MRKKIVVTAALACFGIAALLVAQTGSGTAAPARAITTGAAPGADAAKSRAFVDKYCVGCHNQRTAFPADGPVRLDASGFDDLLGHAETWERVLRKLSVRAMPPPGSPRPTEAEYAGFTGWLAASLDRA